MTPDDTDTPLPPPVPDDEGDHTPLPPPTPYERDSMPEVAALADEDRAARAAANLPARADKAAADRADKNAADRPAMSAEPTHKAGAAIDADARADMAAADRADTAAADRADKNAADETRRHDRAAEDTTTRPEDAVTATVRPRDNWDRAGAWLIDHGWLPALVLITAGIAVIHARIFLGETAGDDLTFHYAESARLADCIARGDWDFWNPSANGGYASLYYYQGIPQLASAIPAAIFGNHLFWFELSVVLPLILAPACAYKGLRLLGATRWQSVVGAFCVGFMNGESRWGSGSAGTFVVGLYTQTWALCVFPLALGYAARWVTAGTNLASAIAWSGMVLLCHPFAGITLGLAVLIAWLTNIVLLGADRVLGSLAPYLISGRRIERWFAARWTKPPERPLFTELWRGAILAVLFSLTSLPILLPLVIDAEGFGGFPHRVSDEVGPGFPKLLEWYATGHLLDFMPKNHGVRLDMLTWILPLIVLFARARFYRWLWGPALVYALMLGLGPDLGKIGDDLFPPVRALGAMQTVLAMGIGAGVVIIGTWIWELADKWPKYAYTIRTILAAACAAAIVLVAVPGSKALAARVRTFGSSDPRRSELVEISAKLAELPQARKQAGPGAENHWWNMLPYVFNRIPSTLQMGGGGLQASPNYDFLWTQRDHVINAWLYDAPYLLFADARAKNIPSGETVIKTANYEVRKLRSPGLVSPVNVIGVLPPGYDHDGPGHKKALEWVKSHSPLKDEVLVYDGFGGPTEGPRGKTLRAWRQDSPGDDADIVAEVEAEAPTTFMVRESWHPRWHAYLDGEEVFVRRVTPDFPAVDVPAGKHTIELRFERPWWTHAAWLAWPLAAVMGLLLERFLRRRRKTA